jgi:hypothetical protein
MRVITAPEVIEKKDNEKYVFLAGGITKCPDWQKDVIEYLEHLRSDDMVVLNPRRENFPINDPSAAYKQIEWEFDALEKADIFSMYFCSGKSDQPICMYELGRNILRMQMKYPSDWEHRIIISVEEGYSRKEDVLIQTELACANKVKANIESVCTDDKLFRVIHACMLTFSYSKIK